MVRTRFVEGSGGVRLAVDESGPASGAPSILFVHGLAQGRGSWDEVLRGRLAERHRLVAIDLRGHGDSDKPEGDGPYVDGVHFAGDLEAVIQQLGLVRPVVVAWSYGGVVVGDYLRRHGDEALGGLFFVAASLKTGKPARALFGPGMMSNARGLMSEDGATYESSARAFVEACAAGTLDASRVDASVRAMQRVPVNVRRALLSRAEDYSVELERCRRPVATLHGELDQVVLPAMSREVVLACARSGQGTWLPGVGHVPFMEATPRFEDALASFVAQASS
ncbi:alpha/beta hydrolase [Myxococcus sp. XM-1-1-1]|uniref:alpha/beta fold hydrolase n=1 Tax=Myxococcus sp. XM-1-1-1 TaxID=2874602 RepID=UPI001CBC6D49|nr:alpha/beta hydrolase [Myxococcus sp. XM-1-1-1]MBZ4410949.1 alpha/beta hydrolase [Myxococcus sp. XM-1-1-1]